MQQSDAQLIQQVLQGNQEAFSPLVKKYQKGAHALAWRKVGDFHIAQEITQDAFLTAYQKLRTLKNHNAFSGWLYVIVARECLDWLRKNRIPTESLDTADSNEVDKVSYSQYVAEKQEEEADETRREVVKELLKKLPESERTVMTLHYLGEMTIKAISEFLGVSQNTVKSRLSRARNRLKKEENVLQQNLGSFQLPDNLADNIMQEVSRLAPVPPAVSKPVAPLAISAASAVLLFLLMGIGTQYLSRFQRPYSLNATSEPTVEIIDAVFVLDSPAKPAIRSQAGSSGTPGKSPGAGQKSDARLFATAPVDATEISIREPQWVQTRGPEGGTVNNLFVASDGGLYAGTGADLYRLSGDGRMWNRINSGMPSNGRWQLTERNDIFYTVSDTDVFASADKGETWNSLGTRPEGQLIDFVITDEAFYLGLVDGVFRSVDAGESWTSLSGGLADRKIRALTAIESTVFVGTDAGLYRRNSEGWEELGVGESENIRALASAGHRLYAAVGEKTQNKITVQIASVFITHETSLTLYRSIDLGNSWQSITPETVLPEETGETAVSETKDSEKESFSSTINFLGTDSSEKGAISSVKIAASREGLLVFDIEHSYYSDDAGETWVTLNSDSSGMDKPRVVAMLDENTFYEGRSGGIFRTTDVGKTWHQFNNGLVNSDVMNLVSVHNTLYANIGQALFSSADSGESWVPVSDDQGSLTRIAEFDDTLYARGVVELEPRLFHLSTENNAATRVPDMPVLGLPGFNELMSEKMGAAFLEAIPDEAQKDIEAGKKAKPEHFDTDKLSDRFNNILEEGLTEVIRSLFGGFAVSGATYYMESEQKLFRWKPGMTEWYNTGLVDENAPTYSLDNPDELGSIGLVIAVSGSTVYVGKRSGRLFQSFDEGDTWNDVTANLPFSVTEFKAITFAGDTLYVATDKGVTYSNNGSHWHTTTDVEGMPLVIERFTIDGTTLYGTSEQRVYQLKADAGTWKQIAPEIPIPITSITVDGNTLYVGTTGSGVLRFTLDESK